MESRRLRLKKYLHAFIDFFYPRRCLACGRNLLAEELFLCTHCIPDIPRTYYHRFANNPVRQLFDGKVDIASAFSFFFFTKGNKSRQLIYHIKYYGNKQLGEYLGKLYAQELLAENKLQGIDIVAPVPLHPKRLKKRGFNQSEYIARGIAKVLNAELRNDLLCRTENMESQTRKSVFARWTAAQNKFKPLNIDDTENKTILLIDDVVTTGATLIACVESLKNLPIKEIHIATLGHSKL